MSIAITTTGVSSARESDPAHIYSPGLSILLVMPMLIILATSFLYPVAKIIGLSFSHGFADYARIVTEPLYLDVLANTLVTALAVSVLCIVLGFPVAYALSRLNGPMRMMVSTAVLIPLWTSVLIRSYAWIVILQRNGPVNALLQTSGLSDGPTKLLYTQGAVIVAMTHALLPFVILPIMASLRAIPPDLHRAALSLGASQAAAFIRVILPLSLPGVFAGTVLSFVLALGFYITPALVGGPGSMLIATLIGQQTTVVLDWPFAAALSTTLLAVTLLIVVLFRRVLMLSKGYSNVH